MLMLVSTNILDMAFDLIEKGLFYIQFVVLVTT